MKPTRELVYTSNRSLVYLDTDSHGVRTIVKLLRNEYPSVRELAQFKSEADFTRLLDGVVGIRRTLEYTKVDGREALILEYVEGRCLKEVLQAGPLSVEQFLQMAWACSHVLSQVHEHGIIHKDISSNNIIFDIHNATVHIIDFGIASSINYKVHTLSSPDTLEGTLAYISPEQTGRVNRAIDSRSDLYSLGVVFYEALAGQLPFNVQDPLSLVHSHIAKLPPPLHEISPAVPELLSRIVLKLLSKNAEDRYQSAKGLIHDLQSCMALRQEGRLHTTDFVPGSAEVRSHLQIQQKLYGRSSEIQALLQGFARTVAGSPELMLIAGYSGVGKSSLVNEVHRPITEHKGYFISGKHDQYQRDTPFFALTRAFNEFCRYILSESGSSLAYWRQTIMQAVGSNGQVLVNVIPSLELVIGKQPELSEVGSQEGQNRFSLVFQSFIRAVAQPNHPLVLFIDDLQWADSASLAVLTQLLTPEKGKCLLVIGAFRDNEVDGSHPLFATIEAIRKNGTLINRIEIGNLSLQNIEELVCDALGTASQQVADLSQLIFKKTLGNAFFTHQFLQSLFQEKLLAFDGTRQAWHWDADAALKKGVSDNVVDLMRQRLSTLSEPVQRMLRLAAALGSEFDLKTLANIASMEPAETFDVLWEAVRFEILTPLTENYRYVQLEQSPDYRQVRFRFSHDRVQQAAYSFIEESARPAVHLKIGRLLLANTPDAHASEQLFDIVGHLNQGLHLIDKDKECRHLVELNVTVGRKAKKSSAYKAARMYFSTARELLDDAAWHHQRDTMFTVHRELLIIEQLNGNFEACEKLAEILLSKAQTRLERADVYDQIGLQFNMRGMYREAIDAVRHGLALFDIQMPQLGQGGPAMHEQIALAAQLLGDRPIMSLMDRPEIEDPEVVLSARLLHNIISAFYIVGDIECFVFCAVKNVVISLKHGNSIECAKGWADFGLVQTHILGNHQRGYEAGLFGFALAERYHADDTKSQVGFVFTSMIVPFSRHLREVNPLTLDCYESGLRAGDLRYAGCNIFTLAVSLFLEGEPLDAVQDVVDRYLPFCLRAKNKLAIDALNGFKLAVDYGRGVLDNEAEQQYIESCEKTGGLLGLGLHLVCMVQLAYVNNDGEAARKYLNLTEKYINSIYGFSSNSCYRFYTALLELDAYEKNRSPKLLETIMKHRGQLEIWAKSCPENFNHCVILLDAELARLAGKDWQTIELYSRAIEDAKDNGFLQSAAVANELAARFWLGRGNQSYAGAHMSEAYRLYNRWGAKKKVELLGTQYASLVGFKSSVLGATRGKSSTSTTATTGSDWNTMIDTEALVRASQAISEEINLDSLLQKLIRLSMESAGATAGLLLQPTPAGTRVRISATIDGDHITTQTPKHDVYEGYPRSIVNYVANAHKSVVIADPTHTMAYASDPYIAEHKPCSVLCMPIARSGELRGVLYLENSHADDAFSAERLDLLNVLLSQAAISLENADLYASLEEKVRARTAELESAHVEILRLTRAATELQMAGGFAHEMRNALSGARALVEDALGYATKPPMPLLDQSAMCMNQTLDILEASLPPQQLTKAGSLLAKVVDHEERLATILKGIDESTHRAMDVTTMIIDYARIGEDQRGSEYVDSNTILDEILGQLRHELSRENINLDVKSDENCLIPANSSHVYCLMVNLLYNARDALQAASNSASRKLSVQLSKENDHVIFGVQDNGVGMSADIISRLGSPFFTTKGRKGTGLGLGIVKKIVNLYEGKLEISSQAGAGSHFRVVLPVPHAAHLGKSTLS